MKALCEAEDRFLTRYCLFPGSIIVLTLLILISGGCLNTKKESVSLKITRINTDTLSPSRYARSFQSVSGDVYVEDLIKISLLNTGQYKITAHPENGFPLPAMKEGGMNSFYSNQGFFISLGYRILYSSDSGYYSKVWRSFDNLNTVTENKAIFVLPEAGKVYYGNNGEWAGLFAHRGIIQLKDGSFLGVVYGNFERDTITPTNPQSRLETRFKLRSFVVSSADQGLTWHYLASMAVPVAGNVDDSEGFNESTLTILDDGRIMGIIRTGHFTPPVATYSTDNGHTWSTPSIIPELGPAACDPYLLKLSDGRIALAYGEMKQPAENQTEYFRNFKAGDHPRRCRLAISTSPSAEHWQVWDITDFGDRSAYPTLFQMKQNLLLYQSGEELYQIELEGWKP